MSEQDPRVQSFRWLLGVGMLLHLFQLQGEDRLHDPAMLWERYLITPGWHQFLPFWMPLGLTLSLVPAGTGSPGSARSAPRRCSRPSTWGTTSPTRSASETT